MGHEVIIENNAGKGSGFDNSIYLESGCQIKESIEDIYRCSDLIVKVKELQSQKLN